MKEYPDIRAGGSIHDTSARQWRQLIEQVSVLWRTVMTDGNVQRTTSGVRMNTHELSPVIRAPEKTVVIVRKPLATDAVLLVREAKYADLPPKPCTGTGNSVQCFYAWHGENFNAYPPLGMRPIDFEGDENTAAVTVPPKIDTVFHRVHLEHDVWVVDAPASASVPISSVRVTSIIGDPNTSERLNVIKVKENDNGAVVDDGVQVEGGYATWYNCFGRHYTEMIGQTPPVILPAVFVAGDWRVLQVHRWGLVDPNEAVATEACP